MGFVISVYSEAAFKEILLPAVNNADTTVILYKDVFELGEDLVLPMEVVDHRWRFQPSVKYRIKKDGYDHTGKVLCDHDVLTLIDRTERKLSILVREKENSFSVFQKYRLDRVQRITIGNMPDNTIVYNALSMVSKHHALLERGTGGWVLKDLDSANGVFVNYRRVGRIYSLKFGDRISIMGLTMLYLGDVLAVDTSVRPLAIDEQVLRPAPAFFAGDRGGRGAVQTFEEKKYFHRVPRNVEKLEVDTMEIDPPPAPERQHLRSALMTIGPALTMALPMLLGCSLAIVASQARGGSSVFMYTGLVTAVSSAVIGTSWAIMNMQQQKKESALQEEKRKEMYSAYLNDCAGRLMTSYKKNGFALQNTYPSAHNCSQYDENSVLLWNRNDTHEDFLFERLGIGEVPFQIDVRVPKQRFSMDQDQLANRPWDLKKSFEKLKDVPVGVDLRAHRLIGVIGGGKRQGAYQVAKSLLVQIAANNCYTDVKIAVLYDKANGVEAENLGSAKWLPHVWSEDKRTRYVADTPAAAGDVLYEITQVIRKRAEDAESATVRPYYVLFVTNPAWLEGELITKYLFEAEEEYGLTTIMLVERYEDLPNACEYIIENDGQFQGVYGLGGDKTERQAVVFDNVSREKVEDFARRLSGIEVNEVETGGEIPTSLSFLDMYHVGRIEELHVENRWMKNRTYDSMKALIGQKAGGVPCFLDVHEKYHGPHGLVAGTTGSGKSETLQTYILSLAVNYSPDDIGFFLIDFKGGGMANLFSGLPHVMGQISNLSGNQVRRAMVSIKSENRRRQRLFNEHSVNNINQYTRLYKDNEASIPIPHLFIVIDEFAELKREEPDFMRELISVAQVGRSLGVHLILATQKPSGTVDDNIWSNSKFRLCLRVQDRQDSNDMLHKPDAAYLTQAGRCYLQVGNDEIYELFQSGYSGSVYEGEDGAHTELATMLSVTGKTALVGNRLKLKKKEKRKQEWMELLADTAEEAFAQTDGTLETVSRSMFEILGRKKADYPDTEYNLRRMEEFIRLYSEVKASKDVRGQSLARAIAEKAALRGSKLPERKEKTQLDAIVEYLGNLAKEKGYDHNFMLWLPILPEKLCLEQLEGFLEGSFSEKGWREHGGWSLQAPVGLYDHPVSQVQLPLVIDLARDGHHAICGTVSSGKSTFLQTLLYSLVSRYTPSEVNIYGIDFSSRLMAAFEGLAHTGGIMYENDQEKIAKFFHMILEMLKERKELFRGGNYAQYVQTHGITVPAVVIAIDQYGAFREKTKDAFEDALIEISRDGASYGIFLVMTAPGFGTTGIQSRIGANIRTVICLEMSDKFQYGEAMRMMHLDVLPEPGVRGRGLARVGESILEFQTALALLADDDYERGRRMKDCFASMNDVWNGEWARQIPEIPKKPTLSLFMEDERVVKAAGETRLLPIGYNMENADIYSVDLRKTFCYLISGKARTGKTNLLKTMLCTAGLKGGKLFVVDGTGSLKGAAQEADASYIADSRELFEVLKGMIPMFKERNSVKRKALEEGYEDEEIYEKISETTPYFFFIDDLPFFIRLITKPDEGVGNMQGFMENITDKGSLHNVFFFAAFNQEEAGSLMGTRVYENMIRSRDGIHLGGNVSAQRILNYDYIPYLNQGREQKAGIGMLPSGEGVTPEMKVLIPYAGRKGGGAS